MKTEVIKVESVGIAHAAVRAAEVLNGGRLVVFPTETVYGVAARADRMDGVERLRDVKGRDADKAFTVHIGAREEADRYVNEMSGLARRIIRKSWPGPLTMVLPVSDPSSTAVMRGLNGSVQGVLYFEGTVGLRCPDDSVAEAVLQRSGGPVIASSANRAGGAPPWTAESAHKDLDGRVDLLIDAGRTRYAKASTIVRVIGSRYEVIREGVFDAGTVERLSKLRLLFVCTGNTCRSPMAAGLARSMLAKRVGCKVEDLLSHGVEVLSAGTGGGVDPATANAVSVMKRRGVDLANHQSKMLTSEMIRQADHVFAMTSTHRARIIEMTPSAASRVSLLIDGEDIHDPVGGPEEEYERCARTIAAGLDARLKEIEL